MLQNCKSSTQQQGNVDNRKFRANRPQRYHSNLEDKSSLRADGNYRNRRCRLVLINFRDIDMCDTKGSGTAGRWRLRHRRSSCPGMCMLECCCCDFDLHKQNSCWHLRLCIAGTGESRLCKCHLSMYTLKDRHKGWKRFWIGHRCRCRRYSLLHYCTLHNWLGRIAFLIYLNYYEKI